MKKVWDVSTLGSTMLSLTTGPGVRLEGSESLRIDCAGAESNCAIGLASLGKKVSWLSKVGATPVGDRIISAIRARAVDVSGVTRAPGRSELMFVEAGFGSNRTNVVYDREGAAIESLVPEEVDLSIIAASRYFHFTGITPALSDHCRETLAEVVRAARAAGVKLSCDVNYRSKLWSPAEAREAISALLPGIDLLLVGQGDLKTLWERDGEPFDELERLRGEFGIANAVLTMGAAGACGLLGERSLQQDAYPGDIVSPIGAGDAFAAGVLSALLDDEAEHALQRGCAMAALARESRSDYVLAAAEGLRAKTSNGSEGKNLSR